MLSVDPDPKKALPPALRPQPWVSSNSPNVSAGSKSQEVLGTFVHGPFPGKDGLHQASERCPCREACFHARPVPQRFPGLLPSPGPLPTPDPYVQLVDGHSWLVSEFLSILGHSRVGGEVWSAGIIWLSGMWLLSE